MGLRLTYANRLVPAALLLLLAFPSLAPAQATEFIRGDTNADGLTEISDVIQMYGYLTNPVANPGPMTGCAANPGEISIDAADFNDNEFLTIADPVKLSLNLFGPTVPPLFAPTSCGVDPDNSERGFNVVDPLYRVLQAPPIVIEGAPRTVRYPLYIDAPTEIVALEIYFNPVNAAVVSNPSFSGTPAVQATSPILGLTVLSLVSPSTLIDTLPGGTGFLGFLEYELAVGATPPDLLWLPSYISGFLRRATLVDTDGADHHPEFTAMTSPLFLRGDCSTGLIGILAEGDGVVDVGDLSYLQHYLWDNAPGTFPDCGQVRTIEPMDTNDNEFVTIADALLLNAVVGGAAVSPLAPPATCGPDPDDSTGGFDAPDPAYGLVTGDLQFAILTPFDIRARFTIGVDTPGPVRGVTFTLRIPNGLTPHAPILTLDPGVSATAQITTRLDGNQIMVTVYDYGATLLPGSGARTLGLVQFDSPQVALSSPIQFVPNGDIGDRSVRMTIVDDTFGDHFPVVRAGTKSFVRGEINDDVAPDIADAIWLLSFLFQSGLAPPCMDAADLNNDGGVDIADVIYELTFLFAGQGQFPQDPYPNCGFDTDVDFLDCQQQGICP
ncbi:MAG: hypothetical protein AAF581_14450 [Planctomycetota bacterium]